MRAHPAAARAIPTRRSGRLIFDSHFDPYRGVVAYVRVVDGELRPRAIHPHDELGQDVRSDRTRACLCRHMAPVERLGPGEVGCVLAGIKNVSDTRIGDTITDASRPAGSRCPAISPSSRWCFAVCTRWTAKISPICRDALEKLQLNDAALQFEADTSGALGFGFPLRLLGPAAHGDRAGTAGAGVRSESHHHRSQRYLPRRHDQRRRERSGQSRPISRRRSRSSGWRSRTCGPPS